MSLFNCFLCPSSCIQCSNCKVNELRKKLQLANETIAFLKGDSLMSLKLKDVFFARKYIKEYESSSGYYKGSIPDGQLSHTYFITLTFDPDKFGVSNSPEDEENYIKYVLAKLCKSERVFNIYGCFEVFQTGVTHSHLIMHTNYMDEIRRELKMSFTDNPRNRVAIQVGPAHKTKSIEYINKMDDGHMKYDPKTFFVYGNEYEQDDIKNDNPLDYGL